MVTTVRLKKDLEILLDSYDGNYEPSLLLNEGTICIVMKKLSYGYRVKISKGGCDFLINVNRDDVILSESEINRIENKSW